MQIPFRADQVGSLLRPQALTSARREKKSDLKEIQQRAIREACRKNGDDPDRLPRTYANTITRVLEGRPAGMTIAMHTCRGNFKSAWVAEGGYEPVAQAMFSAGVDAFFMEFDTERAGGFEPLRFVPRGKNGAWPGVVQTADFGKR